MLATARIEALELWVASEIVGPIIDKAISVVRRTIIIKKIGYETAKRHEEYCESLRALVSTYEAQVRGVQVGLDIARAYRNRAEKEYNRAHNVYSGYREWQNKRWNLAPGSRYSALPEAARHTHPAP